MWSPLALLVFVGVAFAANNPGWKSNTEYIYEVRGRTVSSLREVENQYSGILLKANLAVQPSEEKLRLKILNPEYAEIHTILSEGWKTEIPDGSLSYKPLPMTNKPFEVYMKNGVVRDLVVDQEVPEWEANIIKSFVSQLQLDTRGENLVKSHLNVLPKEGQNNGVFKVLEDTVTGISETTYDIHPIPEYTLQSRPWLVPFPHLKGDGQIIEILKTKDFSKSAEIPAYYLGLSKFGKWQPISNQLGQVMTRTSLGHSVVTGTLNRFTVQYSETINKIEVKPTPYVKERGEVVSYIRIKLTNADQQTNQLPELSSPVHLGRLVYSYGKHQSGNNKVVERPTYQRSNYFRLSESEESAESYENKLNSIEKRRHPRSLYKNKAEETEEKWGNQKLSESPRHPLLPLSDGFYGMPLKNSPKVKIVDEVKRLCEEIGKELEDKNTPSYITLSKFALLTKLISLMNEEELKQVSELLYSQAQAQPQVWQTLRDATAEAGTGPALLVIKEWIESGKIKSYEAAHAFMTMLTAVRQPNEKYIRECYNMVVKQLEHQHPVLNETALLAFSDLLHRAIVDKHTSHRDFPAHVFGEFSNEETQNFVTREYIPYLTKQLREAIAKGDSPKVQTYIRALGHVGHPDIVYVLEPYLEGKQQVSQHQRLLMVLALRKIMHIEPKLGRNILYRMYQNVGETSEIRVAAVHMLLQSNKAEHKMSSDMIQRMAEFTNIDTNHHVCSAVKTLIESLAKAEAPEYAELKAIAEAARPILSKRQYGTDNSLIVLKNQVSDDEFSYLQHGYTQEVSELSGMPNLFHYYIASKTNGYQKPPFALQALTSDLRNLFHVLVGKTEWFHQAREAQKESFKQSKWSSPNVARYLNLKTEELEQLEGSFIMALDQWYGYLNFDNQTIEHMPKMIQKVVDELRNGKQIKFSKLIKGQSYVVAFPTEMGLPFVYNFETPMYLRVKGELKGKTQPELISNGKIQKPETMEGEAKIQATFAQKYSGELGFFCPFNHKHYSAGYNKNRQIHVPIKAQVKVDLKTNNVVLRVEPLGSDKKERIYQESTYPYVSQHDILDIRPNEERKSTHIIRKPIEHFMDEEYGKQTIGMAFRVKYETDNKFPTTFRQMWRGENQDQEKVCYYKFAIEYDPANSKNKEAVLAFTYENKYNEKTEEENNETNNQGKTIERLLQIRDSKDYEQYRRELIKQVSAGIKNAKVSVIQGLLKFKGQQTVEIKGSMGVAKSNVDPKSRVLVYIKKESQIQNARPFEFALAAKSYMPNTNGLNMEYAMKFDPTSTCEIEADFGEQLPSQHHKFNINVQLRKSEERKQFLMSEPLYQKCQREMQQGNNQLLACANVTQMANLLDRVQMEIKLPKMDKDYLMNLLQYINSIGLERQFDIRRENGKRDEVTVKARFSPDLQSCNVTVEGQDAYAKIENIRINDWARQLVVVHPVFNVATRVQGYAYGFQTYRKICTMDQTRAQTFDGTTYPLSLSKAWTVLMQYVPLRSQGDSKSSVEEQLKHELFNYVVLARQNNQEPTKKDIKITFNAPETQGKLVEITLEPSMDESFPKVYVDGQQIQVSEKQAHAKNNGNVEVYGLPNREVKVEINRAFYIIYDGTRVKITSTSQYLRNNIRGLCGNFNGEEASDFVTPNNCVVRDPKEFIATYTVLAEGEQNNEIMNLKARAQKSHCVPRKVPMYVNVISKSQDYERGQQRDGCLKFQTQYVSENGQVCFTKRPVSVCKRGCQSVGQKYEDVEVVCVQNQNLSNLWKSQIDKGANPDFSLKKATKTISMEMPQTCQM